MAVDAAVRGGRGHRLFRWLLRPSLSPDLPAAAFSIRSPTSCWSHGGAADAGRFPVRSGVSTCWRHSSSWREILVSGLREFLAELRVGLPVSQLAKWKTAVQMAAIAFLLVGDAASPLVTKLGLWLIWIAAGLTLITGYDYLRTGLRHMAEDAPASSTSKESAE
jgi:hypothetical protein